MIRSMYIFDNYFSGYMFFGEFSGYMLELIQNTTN
jgi:hypothetical protein